MRHSFRSVQPEHVDKVFGVRSLVETRIASAAQAAEMAAQSHLNTTLLLPAETSWLRLPQTRALPEALADLWTQLVGGRNLSCYSCFLHRVARLGPLLSALADAKGRGLHMEKTRTLPSTQGSQLFGLSCLKKTRCLFELYIRFGSLFTLPGAHRGSLSRPAFFQSALR